MTPIFHELARGELRCAYDWYAERSDTAPGRMLDAVEAAIDRICAAPESYPLLYDRYRWIKLRHFPYILVYELIGDDAIKSLVFAHSSRRPGYWRGRA